MKASALHRVIRQLESSVKLQHEAARDYERMGGDEHQKAFDKARAMAARMNAQEEQEIIDHLRILLKEKHDGTETA